MRCISDTDMTQKICIAVIVILVLVGAYLFFNNRESEPEKKSHRSYNFDVISDTDGIKPNRSFLLTYLIKNDLGETLKDFETVHEKIMHFIAVRKDLQEFQHLHPTFNSATGEFSINIVFPAGGSYRVFTDFTPARSADNPQLLSVTLFYDISVGDAKQYKSKPIVPDAPLVKSIGDYQITFAAPKEIQVQTPITYSLNVKKDGKEVTNLETYLGAFGHSVILRAETLDFIHTHAENQIMDMTDIDHGSMEMKMMESSGPEISFRTTFPQAGLYKIFTQFQHEGKVFTVDFAVEVKDGDALESSQSNQHNIHQ